MILAMKKKQPQWFDKEKQLDVKGYIQQIKQKQPKKQEENSPTKKVVGINEKLLSYAGIHERYADVSFSTLKVNGEIRENAKLVYNYSKNMSEYIKNGIGLILAGGYGTLKTTLAVCILKEYINKGGYGLFIPMSSLMDNLYSMKAKNIDEWTMFEYRLRNTNLLVIDDLGGEDVNAPWVLQKVHSIITERYNRKKTIIITTNLNKQELENTYSGRLIDRLKSTNYYIAFNSLSQRKVMNINDLKE